MPKIALAKQSEKIHKKTIPHTKSVKGVTTVQEIPSKNEFTIVVYGDSMIDTMGEYVDYLKEALKKIILKLFFIYITME